MNFIARKFEFIKDFFLGNRIKLPRKFSTS